MFTQIKMLLAAALATASIAASASAGAPFNATSDPDVLSEKVSLAGLDLHTQTGAEIALHRIRSAANAVCGVDPDLRQLGAKAKAKACLTAAVDHAVAEVDSPLLTAANAGHGAMRAQLAAEAR